MKHTRLDKRHQLIVSDDELHILNNALNEVCHALDLEEFELRIGANRDEAAQLLEEINKIA